MGTILVEAGTVESAMVAKKQLIAPAFGLEWG